MACSRDRLRGPGHLRFTLGLVAFLIWAGWILILTALWLTRDVEAVATKKR